MQSIATNMLNYSAYSFYNAFIYLAFPSSVPLNFQDSLMCGRNSTTSVICINRKLDFGAGVGTKVLLAGCGVLAVFTVKFTYSSDSLE